MPLSLTQVGLHDRNQKYRCDKTALYCGQNIIVTPIKCRVVSLYQFGIYAIPANYKLLQPKTIFVQNCPRCVDKDY